MSDAEKAGKLVEEVKSVERMLDSKPTDNGELTPTPKKKAAKFVEVEVSRVSQL